MSQSRRNRAGSSGCQYSQIMPYEPIIPQGQRLGTSRKVDGAVTGQLFEGGKSGISGNADWQWVDEPQPVYVSSCEHEQPHKLTAEELEQAVQLAAVILEGIVRAVGVAAPHLKRWWKEKSLPAMMSAWKRAIRPRPANSQVAASTSFPASCATFVASTAEIDVAVKDSEISMTSAEWASRFRAMLTAGIFQEEQRRILSHVRIDDGDAVSVAHGTVEPLTPQQFAHRIVLMLATNPSLLNEETAAELMRVFSQLPDDHGMPALEH